MTEDLHDIDDLFRKPIDGHAEEAPADVWGRIDQALDKRQADFYKRKYFTVRYAALALLFIGLAGLGCFIFIHIAGSGRDMPDRIVQNRAPSIPPAAHPGSPADSRTGIYTGGAEEPGAPETRQEKQGAVNDVQKDEFKHLQRGEQKDAVATTHDNDTKGAPVGVAVTGEKQGGKAGGKIGKDEKNNVRKNSRHAGRETSLPENNRSIAASPDRKAVARNAVSGQHLNSQEGSAALVPVNEPAPDKKQGAQDDTFTGTRIYTIGPQRRLAHLAPAGAKPWSMTWPSAATRTAIASAGKAPGRIRDGREGFSLQPFYARGFGMNDLHDDDRYRGARNYREEARKTEQQAGTASFGLLVHQGIGRHLSLQAGIAYFSAHTSIGPKTIFAKADNNGQLRYELNCSSGNSYIRPQPGAPLMPGDSINTDASESRLSYLSIPLGVAARIGIGKVTLRPSAGLSAQFLLDGRISSSIHVAAGKEPVTTDINGLRKMYFSGYVQPAIEWSLGPRFALNLMPSLSFSLMPINKGTAVRTFQNTAALAAGIAIKL